MRSVALIILFILFTFIHDSNEACLVSSKSPLQPVYVTNNTGKYLLLIPEKNGFFLQQGEKVLLLCAGHLNRLNQTNANLSTAICIGRDKFLVVNQIYPFAELECRRPVRANVIHTDNICPSGVLSNIGYLIEDHLLKLVEVCYDTDQAYTVYTKHFLLTPELGKFNGTYTKPTFNTKGLSQDNKSVSLIYYVEAQKARLSSLLQSSILATDYVNNKTYLTRGQLSPNEDFALISWKYATYFFLNACPEWNVINLGNWRLVESMIRQLRNSAEEVLDIITGTYDILELRDRVGNLKLIHLSQRWKKFPVPKYIWKIVYSEKSKKAIVFVVYNNPYDLNPKSLCSCVCSTYGWYTEKWTNFKKGYIQCCSFAQFKQIVRTVPPLSVVGILHGPE